MNELSTWEARIDAASKALEIKPTDLEAKLAELGIQNGLKLEMLNDDDVFKFGDFAGIVKDKKVAVIRLAFKFLKGGQRAEDRAKIDPRALQLRELGFKTKIDDASTEQLLRLYVPDKPSDPVTNALKTRFGTRPVIAFNDDGTVALEATTHYLAGLETGYPEQDAIMVDGKLAKLWPVGLKPYEMVDEDPLFPGTPLREHVSPTNHLNWAKVTTPARQLCRIILERGDIDVKNKDAVIRLLERAEANTLAATYPEADLELRRCSAADDAPKLRVPRGTSSGKPQNPFGIRRQY